MNKLNKMAVVIASTLMLAACFDKADTKTAQAQVEQKVEVKQVQQEPKEQVQEKTADKQVQKEPKEVKQEPQAQNAVSMVEEQNKDPLSQVKDEYLKFENTKKSLEDGFVQLQAKLGELNSQTGKDEAAAVIKTIQEYMLNMSKTVAKIELQTYEVKQLRVQTLETLNLTNDILLDSIKLILESKELGTEKSAELAKDIEQKTRKLEAMTQKLDILNEELKSKLDLQ